MQLDNYSKFDLTMSKVHLAGNCLNVSFKRFSSFLISKVIHPHWLPAPLTFKSWTIIIEFISNPTCVLNLSRTHILQCIKLPIRDCACCHSNHKMILAIFSNWACTGSYWTWPIQHIGRGPYMTFVNDVVLHEPTVPYNK